MHILARQARRFHAQRGFSEDDARARMRHQASREERLTEADLVIDNGGSIEELEAQVKQAWAWMRTLEPVAAQTEP